MYKRKKGIPSTSTLTQKTDFLYIITTPDFVSRNSIQTYEQEIQSKQTRDIIEPTFTRFKEAQKLELNITNTRLNQKNTSVIPSAQTVQFSVLQISVNKV